MEAECCRRNHTFGCAQCGGRPDRSSPRDTWEAGTALNWFEVGIVKRSDGQNVIARAAYNARERLVDERTNRVYDYRHLGEPEWKGIFDPEQAPDWTTQRGHLWNAVERKEDKSTRPDHAQLARDFKIALPQELNAEQRLALVEEFGQEFARKGMVVDAAIHAPHANNDGRNWHVHMLLTMREIGPDGFGNKVRDWNKTAEFDRWMERWSDLGAQHLERAGFAQEAERFKTGHLSRPDRAKFAHERGDRVHFESLLDEPLNHRGPEASGMEKKGRRTRTGDINREIEERNKVRGIPREIREAYALSSDPHAFAEALEQKNMMLARITKKDARSSAIDFAFTDQYVPPYREGQYVVATEQGKAYRLTRMTTGDSFKGVEKFTKPLDQQDCPSLEAALNEMKERSKIPNLDRNTVIKEMMGSAPRDPRFREDAISRWIDESLAHTEARFQPGLTAEDLRPEHRTAVPNGAKHLGIRGTDAEQVWGAYNTSADPEKFHESLKERGLHLARVTAEDASDSHTKHWAAKRYDKFSPILGYGEYVVVSDRGSAFRLGDYSVGHSFREVKAFMSKLDAKPMPTLREVQNAVDEKRLKELYPRPDGFAATNLRTGIGPVLRPAVRTAGRIIAKPLDWAAGAFESLFSPKVTPEERRLAEVMEHEQQLAAERAERHRNGGGRDR